MNVGISLLLATAAHEPSTLAKFGIPALSIALAFVIQWFWRYRTRVETEAAENRDRIAALEKNLAIVETQVSPMWAAVQSKIVKDLLHPSPQFKEMDGLLYSLVSGAITDEERGRLGVLLEERIVSTDPEVSDDEKETAMHTKWIMQKVVDEARAILEQQRLDRAGRSLPS